MLAATAALAGTADASNATLKATLDRWSTTIAADARAVSLAARQRHPRMMTTAALRVRRDALLARTAYTDYARAGAKWAASGRARVAHRLLLAAADARAAASYARAGNRLLVAAGTLLG